MNTPSGALHPHRVAFADCREHAGVSFDLADDATRVNRRRRSGKLSHRFHLGELLDAERLEAGYDFGVLTIRIPIAESAKPRKVPVGAGAASAAIDAESAEAN